MSDTNPATIIYDVYWEGPYSLESIKLDKISAIAKPQHCLYQIYGDHPAYGRDALLYIGKTEAGIEKRMAQHFARFSNQSDEVKVFFASFGQFTNWQDWKKSAHYQPADPQNVILNAIEQLLIYSHQPAYNSQSLCSTEFAGQNLRIFNSGRRKSLMPEISTQFYRDDKPQPPSGAPE